MAKLREQSSLRMRRSDELTLVALDESEFPLTSRVLREGVEAGVAPGMVAGFWSARDPLRFHAAAIGNRRLHPSVEPMTVDTVFDLASVSKVFATATLAAILVERRWIRWDAPLKSFLPEYPDPDIELRHLLSHTAGLPAWSAFYEQLRERFAPVPIHSISIEERQLAARALVQGVRREAAIGERALYSDITFLLLGFALEEATGMPLDHAVERFVWEPLGVSGAFYRRVDRPASDARLELVAATEDSEWRGGVLQGQVHDDNCWAMGGYSGHAGAFCDIRGVLHFAAQWLGGHVVSREVREAAWTRVAQPPGCERTLGWDTPSGPNPSAGRLVSPRTVGHLGYTGTSLWIDRDAELAIALLTNRVHPTRENVKIREFRPRFHEALCRDLAAMQPH